MNYKRITQALLLLIPFLTPFLSEAQISAGADAVIPTEYSSGAQDNIYIFCSPEGVNEGELTAKASNGAGANYEWLKYNPATGIFEAYTTDQAGSTSSTISNLADGAYRVTITAGAITETYTAWALNSWYSPTAEITESNCDFFQLTASFTEAELTYYDLANGAPKQVSKNVQVKWEAEGEPVASVISPAIYSPPAKNTDYKLTVYDRFDCSGEVTVPYQSIVTEASFTYVINGQESAPYEAPMEVSFTSTSLNADQYEWSFFRDRDELVLEGQNGTVEDSILLTAIDPNPTITYERPGSYKVKLVTTKNSDDFACTDTFYMEGYLVADTSFVRVPNVFTPNGDGANDDFVVSYWSLQSINIQVFNRWGKKVHSWENNNIRGFDNTVSESVWDGKIGGRYASPGVYYYVVEARGRDDKKRYAHGFVHLFREK